MAGFGERIRSEESSMIQKFDKNVPEEVYVPPTPHKTFSVKERRPRLQEVLLINENGKL